MLTVILSEIVAVKIDAACWMPARKLAGAAMAAASNNRLIVMPPDVAATTVVAPLCAPDDWTASLVRAGVDGISTAAPANGFSPLLPAWGKKLVYISASVGLRKLISKAACGS